MLVLKFRELGTHKQRPYFDIRVTDIHAASYVDHSLAAVLATRLLVLRM